MYRISYPAALRDGIRARFGVTWPAVPPPVRIIVFINASMEFPDNCPEFWLRQVMREPMCGDQDTRDYRYFNSNG